MVLVQVNTELAFVSGATIKSNLQEDIQDNDFIEDETSENDSANNGILEEQEWIALGFSSNFN